MLRRIRIIWAALAIVAAAIVPFAIYAFFAFLSLGGLYVLQSEFYWSLVIAGWLSVCGVWGAGLIVFYIIQRLAGARAAVVLPANQGASSRLPISDRVKVSIILGASAITATGLWTYFSPYQTCLRANASSQIASISDPIAKLPPGTWAIKAPTTDSELDFSSEAEPADAPTTTMTQADIDAAIERERLDGYRSAAMQCAAALAGK